MAQPELTAEQQREMLTALQECVVLVRAGGQTGTGFFIADEQVLTCHHVIKPAVSVAARISVAFSSGLPGRGGREIEAALQDDQPSGWPDAAILSVPGTADSRCVAIDSSSVAPGTPLLTAGYSINSLVAYQVQRRTADEPGWDDMGLPLMRIVGGDVNPGMSGSPVVNLQSGLVCGIQIVKRDVPVLGGFAMLFADFIDQFPHLVALNDRPPEAARGWLRILTALQLKSVGRDLSGARLHTEVTSSSEHPTPGQPGGVLPVVSDQREAPVAPLSVGTEPAPATGVPGERSPDSSNQQAKLFISYSHRDERYLNRLETHLTGLRREGVITEWHDQMITPGDQWRTTIADSLDSADCVLLLITPDFIASEYCYGVEMGRALERHRQGHTLVLPVIVRPADWERTPLGELQALPKNGKPIVEWSNQDRAWLDVISGMRRALLHLPQ